MRASGKPESSTVANDIALGSLGSALTASANHSANRANGSSAAVKSPDVNGVGCWMDVVSVMPGDSVCICLQSRAHYRPGIGTPYIGHGRALAYPGSGRPVSS